MLKLFLNYLWLGCCSFGGPAAHIGYFRRVFVEQKAWLNHDQFAANLALCQFLPGPTSSQLGFLIALQRGGIAAAVLAFLGFTLPSLILMYGLAVAHSAPLLNSGLVSGMKLLAVAVVADAIWAMARQFCRRPATLALTVVSAFVLLAQTSPAAQITLLSAAALWGYLTTADIDPERKPLVFSGRYYLIAFFAGLLFCLILAVLGVPSLIAQFYWAGSLVFGGGHVVLPLLQSLVGQSLGNDQFLLGYAAAQALPGPMFSFSAYLGAALRPDAPLLWALAACAAIFLPGFLLLIGIAPLWSQLAIRPRMIAAIAAVNAVAVGMLVAAWVNPVLSAAPHDVFGLSIAVLGFIALRSGRVPVLGVIVLFALLGYLRY